MLLTACSYHHILLWLFLLVSSSFCLAIKQQFINVCANSKGSGETARTRWLVWAFAVRSIDATVVEFLIGILIKAQLNFGQFTQ